MKKILAGIGLVVSVAVGQAQAADVKVHFEVADAIGLEKVRDRINPDIALYWGKQAHPRVKAKHGTFKTSKRTNAFGKSRFNACSWALASAIIELQERAEREGGNAVINIVSNIKDHPESSETSFSCLAGFAMVNVALKGEVVTLAK